VKRAVLLIAMTVEVGMAINTAHLFHRLQGGWLWN
jgi:hypothetical protein